MHQNTVLSGLELPIFFWVNQVLLSGMSSLYTYKKNSFCLLSEVNTILLTC